MKKRKVPLNKKSSFKKLLLISRRGRDWFSPTIPKHNPEPSTDRTLRVLIPNSLKNTKPIFADGLLLLFAERAGLVQPYNPQTQP